MSALGAERLTGEVRGIGLDGKKAAVLDDGDAAAARTAEGAVAANTFAHSRVYTEDQGALVMPLVCRTVFRLPPSEGIAVAADRRSW